MENKVPDLPTISEAHDRISPYIHRTPVLTSQSINEIAGCQIYFKCENFQKVGAFKARGALNAIFSLSDGELERGVTTHSSGNHAQAVALAAKMRNAKAYIVMPSSAPEVKRKAVLGYGAEVITCEPTLEARENTCQKLIEEKGATFIHPYDDYKVIAGQATAAKELIAQVRESEKVETLDVIMTPVGGGGLLAGTALSVHLLSPDTTVIAGEPTGADDAYRSFEAGHIIPSTKPNTIADGLLTSLGERNFDIIKQHVEKIITVTDEEIVAAMRLIWERMKIIIEPSCAVPLAALLKQKEKFEGLKVGLILTGGNVDLGKLPF
ncbi:MAG: pyridoxal-phosphate dependent enzyme [Bacteroidota bacterium]